MSSQAAPASRLKLVLVDDHDSARDALVRRLSTDTRLTVVGATASLDLALELARGHAPHVALVDTRRRDEQGVQIVSALAALPEAARPLVVVYTSFFDANDWRRLHVAGAREWLLKQIDVDVLYARLTEAVKRELPGWRRDSVR